jgi:hypothetical protein
MTNSAGQEIQYSCGLFFLKRRTIEPQCSVLGKREAMAMHNSPGLSSVGLAGMQ